MKFIFLLFSLFPQNNPINYQTIRNSELYELRINYWFNMHHFLKQESFLQTELDSTIVRVELSETANEKLEEALSYYNTELAGKDLRTDDYMSEFKIWVSEIDGDPKFVPDRFKAHFEVLRTFSDVYERYFWDEHMAKCMAALDKYLPLIQKLENPFWDEITDITKTFVLDDTIKIDVVYYGKSSTWNTRNRPYTSIFPTRLVMNTCDYDEVEGEWLELLFHETAHALILSRTGFVAGTIIDVAENMNVEVPRQLGHAYLFYMTGFVAQKLLIEEGYSYSTTYMENKNVFSRYHASLNKLDAYLNGDQTLANVTADILMDLTKD